MGGRRATWFISPANEEGGVIYLGWSGTVGIAIRTTLSSTLSYKAKSLEPQKCGLTAVFFFATYAARYFLG